MNRAVARGRQKHQKGGGDTGDLPFNVSPKMLKMVEKYMWVFFVLFGVLLVIAYFLFSPYLWRIYYWATGAASSQAQAPFDFYVLQLQWPGTACLFSTRGACADGG